MTSRLSHRVSYSGEPVVNDPRLKAAERETCFHMRDGSPLVDFNSHSAAVIRGFLAAPFVLVDDVELLEPEGVVVGLSGSLPIGALSIHPPRRDDRPSRVITRAARQPAELEECVVATQSRRSQCLEGGTRANHTGLVHETESSASAGRNPPGDSRTALGHPRDECGGRPIG